LLLGYFINNIQHDQKKKEKIPASLLSGKNKRKKKKMGENRICLKEKGTRGRKNKQESKEENLEQ
jgi:hypothetical protein